MTTLHTPRAGRAILLQRLLLPGTQLMQRLKLSTKLTLLGLMLLLPLLLVQVSSVEAVGNDIDTTAAELEGARLGAQLIDLVQKVQNQRDLSHRALSGDAQARAELAPAGQALLAQLRVLDSDARTAALIGEPWKPASTALHNLARGQGPSQRNALFDSYSQQVEALRTALLHLGERSGLLLDPMAATYFMMDLSVERTVPWLEALSTARGLGTALLNRGDASGKERAAVIGQAHSVRKQLEDLDFRMAALQRAGVAQPGHWAAARAASEQFGRSINEVFGADALTAEPATFDKQGSAAMASTIALKNELSAALIQLLEARLRDKTHQLWLQVTVSATGIGLLIYLALAFYTSFSAGLGALHRSVEAATQGNLTTLVRIPGRDELATIGTLVEQMNLHLSAMVAEIRSSAVRVGMSGESVSESSQMLAIRTDEQASTLRQTVATVSQLSEAVAHNAAAAQELDGLTQALYKRTEDGGSAMRNSLQAMVSLEDSSRRVAEIIGVIDGIAFQTNILALNAAVEAARAGEAGRGFAVVAAEVRMLAQRSATAAAEIRALIAKSTEQVAQSARQTRDVGSVLADVVSGAQQVSSKLRSISQASVQQSVDLEQVSTSVGNLEEITRQNNKMVEDSTGASFDLVERAQALSRTVASIQLRQGTADEARTLVDRALPLLKTQGLQGAMATLQSRDEGFVDRDLYVFVIDRQGIYRVHGAKPAMQGKRIHDVPGIDGDRFVQDAWAVPANGGWVDYEILNLETGQIQPKTSFLIPVDAHHLAGCGVYHSVAAAAA